MAAYECLVKIAGVLVHMKSDVIFMVAIVMIYIVFELLAVLF